MTGVALSRWTMAYFASALVALVVAEVLMAAGYGYPAAPVEAAETLVLVHIAGIGWLSLLMWGALFQFVPVLVAKPLYSNTLPLPTLACLLTGLLALLLGFLQLGGSVTLELPFFPTAALLLGAGFALGLYNLGRTLWVARPLPLPARFVVAGLASAAAAVALGMVFALVLGGVSTPAPLVDLMALGLPIHVIAALGGWLTFTAMGVSYRLLAMFMLAPELKGPTTRAALYAGAAALTVAIVGGITAICLAGDLPLVLGAATVLGLAAVVLYGADIVHLYQMRRRRKIELNSRMAAFALGGLLASAAVIVALLGADRLGEHAADVVFLVGFGWLSCLGLAKLYKIVAFLTWLECYGPFLGKMATPRVQDLVVEPDALKWFGLYVVAAWSAAATLFLGELLAFRALAGLMAVATCGIAVHLVRTRRLVEVKGPARLPAGARLPRLLFSSPTQNA